MGDKHPNLEQKVDDLTVKLGQLADKVSSIVSSTSQVENTEVHSGGQMQQLSATPKLDEQEDELVAKMVASPTAGMVIVKGPRGAERLDMFAIRLGQIQDLRESRNVKYGASRKVR